MDSSCLPALIRVTGHVLALHDRLLERDPTVAAEVEMLDALLGGSRHGN